MKQNSSIFIFLFFASKLFAQIPAVTSTTHWQVYDGNSTWVPSALDFKNYCLSGLAGLAPTGGTDGQVLTKQSSTNYDYAWETPSGGGGGGVATVTGPGVDNTDADNPVVNARPYKVYTALLTQSGTSDPVPTVLENTFGGTLVWTRTDVGYFNVALSGAFSGTLFAPNGVIKDGGYADGNDYFFAFAPIDGNNILFTTGNANIGALDGVLTSNSNYIEIRVYP